MAATKTEGKPGTNWKQVTPENRKRISAIVRHYMKDPHPFTACVRDNTKRFGEERARRVCAVVKDIGERTTKWRKGAGAKVVEAAATEDAALAAIFDAAFAPTLDAAGVTLDELAGWVEDAQAAGLLLEAGCDDLTAAQVAAAAPAAADRLALLDRLGLPATGRGAATDQRIVEAAASGGRLAAARKAMKDRADGKTDSQGSGKFEESKHRRGFGGKFVTTGASGREVRAVQRRVGARVDGDFGDKTKAAVVKFQKAHGLVADGVVGRQTVAALRGRKDAKRVSVGKLSDGDRKFLDGHVRGNGGRKRVVEAAVVSFVEGQHPRDVAGKFKRKVAGLKVGETAELPDGVAIKRADDKSYELHHKGKKVPGQERTDAAKAADLGADASAGNDDEKSIGGKRKYAHHADAIANHGQDSDKQVADRADYADRRKWEVAAQQHRADAKRLRGQGREADAKNADKAAAEADKRARGGTKFKESINKTLAKNTGKSKRVVEAVAVGGLLQRVRDLEMGEHAMLPDGGAVRHYSTPDGREVWCAGRPVTWSADRISWDDSSARRKPEEAVTDALTQSAGRNDPESVGGARSWYWGADCLVNGQDANFRGVNENGDPIVRLRDVPNERVASWASITPPPRENSAL